MTKYVTLPICNEKELNTRIHWGIVLRVDDIVEIKDNGELTEICLKVGRYFSRANTETILKLIQEASNG